MHDHGQLLRRRLPARRREGRRRVDAKDLAIDFLVYGALAEIFARDTGFNRGLGGSMHAFFPPFGVYPNNAIVGGSGDISVGAALFKHVNQQARHRHRNIGDASAGCGPVWEGLCFATMDQFKELWDEAHRGGLPLIMNFVNNFYGMGGQPVGETMGFKVLARLGAGITPDQMHAERVDGYNPLAVIDAIRRKTRDDRTRRRARAARHRHLSLQRPFAVRRQLSYREKNEVEAWQERRSARHLRAANLVDAGVCTQADIDAMQTPHRRDHPQGLQEGHRPGDLAARRPEEHGCLLERVDVLQPARSRSMDRRSSRRC